MNKHLLIIALASLSIPAFAQDSIWYKDDDPLKTQIYTLPKIPDGYREPNAPCGNVDLSKPITLAEVADTSLCNNPQTSEVWASARVQAAQLGIAKSAYLPSLNDNISTSLGISNPESSSRSNPTMNLSNSLVASYLLYDFGNRNANLENARQLLLSASASQSSTVQSVLLTATVAYYQVQANIAALDAAREAERASEESFKAADARYKAGVSTPADKLQAQTAFAQLTLTRITSEGNLQIAYGNLVNVMGLPANQKVVLIANTSNPPANILEDVNTLIEQASTRRPDLVASEAQVKAAQANIDASKAASKPTISVSMSNNLQDGSQLSSSNNSTLGLTVSIPLFAGYAPTYRIRAAEATADLRAAQRDRLRLQISLDVWSAYQSLRTALESVTATEILVTSAEQSYRVALGRYKAGVGNIIDTLNAQSALASANQQKIQAALNSNIARATLAQAMGALDNAMIQSLPNSTLSTN
ncbi:TolC family protein [Methylotenera versatilis]|uniref:TolC family protein n=1 Tax=Methylotenera versatilis TaxID=1055487 RepID=UPI0006455BC0|nr:TolC family protein [Methylotenera versatilis]